MKYLIAILLPAVFLIMLASAYAQSIRSPLIFKINQEVKKLEGFVKTIEQCENSLRDCAYYFIRTQHRDYNPDDEYGEGFTTRIFDLYGTAKFPVGTINRLKEIEISQSILDMVNDFDDIEAAYFDGHVYSESDSYEWIEPTRVRCAVIVDTRYNEYMYLCY